MGESEEGKIKGKSVRVTPAGISAQLPAPGPSRVRRGSLFGGTVPELKGGWLFPSKRRIPDAPSQRYHYEEAAYNPRGAGKRTGGGGGGAGKNEEGEQCGKVCTHHVGQGSPPHFQDGKMCTPHVGKDPHPDCPDGKVCTSHVGQESASHYHPLDRQEPEEP